MMGWANAPERERYSNTACGFSIGRNPDYSDKLCGRTPAKARLYHKGNNATLYLCRRHAQKTRLEQAVATGWEVIRL